MTDLSMAGELAEYGRRIQNQLALVVAAQIMKSTPTQDKKMGKISEGKEVTGGEEIEFYSSQAAVIT